MGWRQSQQVGSKEARKCYRYSVAGYFEQEYSFRKKGGEKISSNFIGSITESEGSDELLVVSEESMRCSVSEMTSKGSAECRGFEGVATVFEV